AKTIEWIETTDGTITAHAMSYFNAQGNVQQIVFLPNILGDIKELKKNSDDLIFFISELKDNQRKIFIYSQETNEWIDMEVEKWSSPYESISAGYFLSIKEQFNTNGSAKRREIKELLSPYENEITSYYYLKENEQKLESLITDLAEGEKLIFVTTLEVDEKGSWIKRQEEELGGETKIQTRIIEYYSK
ncbi:hypothetical protein, partial [Wohlfahrtiimonas larvae]